MKNIICALLGHKWRDTSYWEFKRENEQKMCRKIVQVHCDRCNDTKVIKVNPWEVERTMSKKMLEYGTAIVEGWKRGLDG